MIPAQAPEPGFTSTGLVPVEVYQSQILGAIRALRPTELELADAEGCVLAGDVTAGVSLPSFDNSSMDGYAVLAADLKGASEHSPVTLPVTAEIAAGDTGAFGCIRSDGSLITNLIDPPAQVPMPAHPANPRHVHDVVKSAVLQAD